MKRFLFFIFSGFPFVVFSQSTIHGGVYEKSSQQPLSEALLTFKGISTFTCLTDSSGRYALAPAPGNYTILVEKEGFKTTVTEDIEVQSGHGQVLDFELPEYRISLKPVDVFPKKETKEFGLKALQQYAAVFYDPARLINSKAAAINTDDQSNNISIHGSNPNYIQWKIEGVEVVNPNHLENSGTMNDRPTLNGGGVSMLSAQVLANSDFQFAPFDPLSGNALTGVFDMKFRKGNELQSERVIQASFLGTDLSVEGPFSKKSKSSYLINARYSTIGLLSAMGVNFGDEKTNYKDVTYSLDFPHRHGTIKLFGVLGSSETLYKGKTDTLEIEIQKELQNINYHSVTTINGFNIMTNLSNTMYLKTVVAYSEKSITRETSQSSAWKAPEETDALKQGKWSSVIYLSKRLSNSYNIKAGSYLNYFKNSIVSRADTVFFADGSIAETVIQPFLSLEGTLFKNTELKTGLHSMYLPRTGSFSLQPRAELKYFFSSDHGITLSYGVSSQLQPGFLYLSSTANRHLSPTESQSFSFQHNVNVHLFELKHQVFYQSYKNIPTQPSVNFSAFNYLNEQTYFMLDQGGRAIVYGYDLSVEKKYRGFYGILSLSFFNSRYSILNKTYSARFNSGYNSFITLGKEWRLADKKRFISAGLRATARNGFHQPDPEFPADRYVYSEALPVYKRVDLRISYRKNRPGSTVIWALDIQNASNAQNIAYYYVDHVTKKVEAKYQLGLIPVLSYKILF